MFDRLETGPPATVAGAFLLILGGVIIVAHGGLAGTIVAALGGLIVVRERARRR